MELTHSLTFPARWQDYLGRGLMWFAAAGALSAFIFGFTAVQLTPSATIWLETWRSFGFLVFTGMFTLLALRPRHSAGIWELAFFHKAAMALSALALPGVKEAASAGAIDAVLAVLLLTAYILTRGWQSWQRITG